MNKKGWDSNRAYMFNRQSLRLPTHDYTWTGPYFVTIRAKEPGPLFEISELRKILQETWEDLPRRFSGITLDEFIIMPDHVYFIVWLEGLVEDPPHLEDVVGAYKSLTTNAWLKHIKAANLNCRGSFWQYNYYDRCIREKGELEKTRHYIRANPLRWKQRDEGQPQ